MHTRQCERKSQLTHTDPSNLPNHPTIYPHAPSLKAACIIVHTEDGTLARIVAKYQPSCACLCFTSSHKVAKQVR